MKKIQEYLRKADAAFCDDSRFARLEETYKGSYILAFDDEAEVWVVDTKHGVEYGDAAYVAGEFCGDNVVYPYNNAAMPDPLMPDHEHRFEDIIESLFQDPESFSVEHFKDCYAAQELRVLHNLQGALLMVKERNYPLSREEKNTV